MTKTIDKYGNPILTGNRIYKCGNPELVFRVNMTGSLVRDGRIAFKYGEWFPSDYVVEGKEPLETNDTPTVAPAEPEPEAPAEPKVPFLNEEEAADLYEQTQTEQQAESKSTQERQMEFLSALKEHGSANKALKATGINWSVVQNWRIKDKAFLARYNEVLAETGNTKYIVNRVSKSAIDALSDQALVDALRSRGWTVKCEKMVSL